MPTGLAPPPLAPTGRASSRRSRSRPPASGTPRPARRSSSSEAMTGPVSSAAFSPDGSRIVTASSDKTARIWDAATGKEIVVLRGHDDDGLVFSAAFSPDGSRIVTASDDKTARIWDAATGKEIVVLRGHDDGVTSAAFSPDGSRIVTASDDKTARIWDAATGKEIVVLRGHDGPVNSAAFSPDGSRIVTASDDKTARIWDVHFSRLLTPANTPCLTTCAKQHVDRLRHADPRRNAARRGLVGQPSRLVDAVLKRGQRRGHARAGSMSRLMRR